MDRVAGAVALHRGHVPETAVRLEQQLGRLIRAVGNHGTATVLNRRLVTKRWSGLLKRACLNSS